MGIVNDTEQTMSKRSIKLYAVWTNTDLTEGRGQEYVQYFCKLESTARRLARGNYVMGSDSRVSEETWILKGNTWYAPYARIVQPSTVDLEEERKLEVQRKATLARERALNRARELGLSEADIQALKG
jgi:hypothetical protein